MMIAGLISDVARKAIDRWFASIILPGLLFAIALASARDLRWAHMTDLARLRADASHWLTGQHGTAASDVVLIIGVICAGIVAGIAATGLSRAISAFWLRRTGLGRKLRTVETDVSANYGVSLARAWPRLWLISPDNARQEVQAAWDSFAASSLQAAWGAIYSLLGFLWPPAMAIGLLLLTISYGSAYRCAQAFAELTRALTDITMNQLASTLGVETPHGRVTPDVGREINEILYASDPATHGRSTRYSAPLHREEGSEDGLGQLT